MVPIENLFEPEPSVNKSNTMYYLWRFTAHFIRDLETECILTLGASAIKNKEVSIDFDKEAMTIVDLDPQPGPEKKEEGSGSSTTLIVILIAVGSVLLAGGAIFFIKKRRDWKLKENLSSYQNL